MEGTVGSGPDDETTEGVPVLRPAMRDLHRAELEADVLRHLDALHTLGLRLSGEREAAEALVSDTVLQAVERRDQYGVVTDVRTWLFTILVRLFVRRTHRTDAPTPRRSEESSHWSAYEAIGHHDPLGRFYDAFLDEQIARAIDELPHEYRVAVLLGDLQGLRYAEVAEVLGIPERTVRSRLIGGRRLLQRMLVGDAVEMGYLRPSATRG